MAGKPGLRVIDAMLSVIDDGITLHAAALRFGVSPITMYRSPLRGVERAELVALRREAVKRQRRR